MRRESDFKGALCFLILFICASHFNNNLEMAYQYNLEIDTFFFDSGCHLVDKPNTYWTQFIMDVNNHVQTTASALEGMKMLTKQNKYTSEVAEEFSNYKGNLLV